MSLNGEFLNFLTDFCETNFNYIGLIDEQGNELSGGGYVRLAPVWEKSEGRLNLFADLTYDVTMGVTISGWKLFNSLEDSVGYGGGNFSPVLAETANFILSSSLVYINLSTI